MMRVCSFCCKPFAVYKKYFTNLLYDLSCAPALALKYYTLCTPIGSIRAFIICTWFPFRRRSNGDTSESWADMMKYPRFCTGKKGQHFNSKHFNSSAIINGSMQQIQSMSRSFNRIRRAQAKQMKTQAKKHWLKRRWLMRLVAIEK